MQHGGIKIQATGERKFRETCPAIKSAPVRQSRDALPTILPRQRSDIHPVPGRDTAVLPALFVDLGVEVVACRKVPRDLMQRLAE